MIRRRKSMIAFTRRLIKAQVHIAAKAGANWIEIREALENSQDDEMVSNAIRKEQPAVIFDIHSDRRTIDRLYDSFTVGSMPTPKKIRRPTQQQLILVINSDEAYPTYNELKQDKEVKFTMRKEQAKCLKP